MLFPAVMIRVALLIEQTLHTLTIIRGLSSSGFLISAYTHVRICMGKIKDRLFPLILPRHCTKTKHHHHCPAQTWKRICHHHGGLMQMKHVTYNRRKRQSQTSDNMERWKAKKRRKEERQRKSRRKKIQARESQKKEIHSREMLGKSLFVVFSNDLWVGRVKK